MTELLDQAIATVSALPPTRQDEIARVLLQLAGVEQPTYMLNAEEEADLDASIAEAERGEFASDDEVAAVWAKFKR
jgi:predicted transcriptional regulator